MLPRRDIIFIALGVLTTLAVATTALAFVHTQRSASFSATEAGFDESDLGPAMTAVAVDPYADWTRPQGPLRVGLQAGHWLAYEAPEELANIRHNGAYAVGIAEWEVNLAIAEAARDLLESHGIAVDILPATIPPDYWADAFVSIHADDNDDVRVNGYKVASPRRDRSGKSAEFAALIEEEYGVTTGLALDPNITRNMRGYYAFNWRRYEHSLHPMAPAVILETGFLSNAGDRRVIVQDPDRAADGLVRAVLIFLERSEDAI
jgi:N-acetylmuramoyl-L-alanine amidase